MKSFTIGLLLGLLIVSYALPLPDEKVSPASSKPSAERNAVDNAALLRKLRSPELLDDELRKANETLVSVANYLRGVEAIIRVIGWMTADPPEENLTEYAQQTVEVARKIPVNFLSLFIVGGNQFSLSDLTSVKRLLKDGIKHDGNDFLTELKKESPELYCVGLRIKRWAVDDIQKIEEDINKDCGGGATQSYEVYLLSEVAQLFRSEKTALKAMKDYSALMHFANVHTEDNKHFEILETNGRWNSFRIIIERLSSCAESHMSVDDLKRFKMDFSTVKDALKTPLIEDEISAFISLMLSQLEGKMPAVKNVQKWLGKCLLDGDNIRDVAGSSDAVLTEEKLQKVQAKDLNEYAVLYKINEHVKVMRARDGFSPEAEEFVKKVFTAPNTLLWVADHLLTDDEVLKTKAKEARYRIIDDFNALPQDIKKEIIMRFPYRFFAFMAFYD